MNLETALVCGACTCGCEGARASVETATTPTLRWRTSPRVNDITSQYRITADGAAWAEKSQRRRLRSDGRDRMSFLHALLSNDVEQVEPGAGVYAVYLTPQGRMLADLRLYNRGEFLVADVPAAEAAPLVA